MSIELLVPSAIARLGFTSLDAIAFAWFLVVTVGYNVLAKHGVFSRHNLMTAIQVQRRRWMANMAMRHDRVIDTLLISSLAAGNTFFASTSIILLGALSTLLGASANVQIFIIRLPFAQTSPPVVWDVKIILMMALFVYAFLKFSWAFRLAHYAMIMVGATPLQARAAEDVAKAHAERTARLAGIAAEHSNIGLRAYYSAIACLAWFVHPLLFIAATTVVTLMIVRREYFSRSLRAITEPAGP